MTTHEDSTTVTIVADDLAPGMTIDLDGVDVDVESVAYDLSDLMIVATIRYSAASIGEFEFYVDEGVPVYRRSIQRSEGVAR